MPAVFGLLKKFAVKAIGSHLVKEHVESPQTNQNHTLENMIGGVGWRFMLGVLFALYFSNAELPLKEYSNEDITYKVLFDGIIQQIPLLGQLLGGS